MTGGAPRQPTDSRFAPPTPFARLLYTHALSACADACVAASLAGSIFFKGASSGHRDETLLYLLITMAPFAVVAPLLGPAIDRTRGGRRLLVAVSCAGRAILSILLAEYVTKGGSEGLLIFPLAFTVLVLQKGYSIAKSSLVPALVKDEAELVKANSRLALISLIASAVGGAPAFGLQQLLGGEWSLGLAAVIFAVAAGYATKIPRVEVQRRDAEEVELEREEMHLPSILLAGSAMGVMRAVVGFLVLFTVFSLKGSISGAGLCATFAGIGGVAGNLAAPMLRERTKEESVLVIGMFATGALVLVGALAGGTFGFALAGLGVGVGANVAKLGFDSLLQRDGPDAVRGRAFAKFETRFQMAWVLGALIGIIPMEKRLGLLLLAALAVFAGASYFGALRAARGRVYRTTIRPRVFDKVFHRARDEAQSRWRRSKSARRKGAAEKRATRKGVPGEIPPPSHPTAREDRRP